jgi:hypothetical protein
MNQDDAVTVQTCKRSTAEGLRLSQGWGGLDAEHVAILRPNRMTSASMAADIISAG